MRAARGGPVPHAAPTRSSDRHDDSACGRAQFGAWRGRAAPRNDAMMRSAPSFGGVVQVHVEKTRTSSGNLEPTLSVNDAQTSGAASALGLASRCAVHASLCGGAWTCGGAGVSRAVRRCVGLATLHRRATNDRSSLVDVVSCGAVRRDLSARATSQVRRKSTPRDPVVRPRHHATTPPPGAAQRCGRHSCSRWLKLAGMKAAATSSHDLVTLVCGPISELERWGPLCSGSNVCSGTS